MDSTILAIRAITTMYIKRLLLPILLIGITVYLALLALIALIAINTTGWWWLVAVVPTIIIMAGLIIWIIARIIVGRVAPVMNKERTEATKRCIKKIDGVAERIGTPKFIVLYRMIKDIVSPPTSSKTFIGEIASEPGEMRREFDKLRSMF